MKTIPFKPRDPETPTVGNVIGWPMKRLTIDVPIDLHIRLKTGCAMRGEKIADVVRVMIEREFPPAPQS
jgi:ParG